MIIKSTIITAKEGVISLGDIFMENILLAGMDVNNQEIELSSNDVSQHMCWYNLKAP